MRIKLIVLLPILSLVMVFTLVMPSINLVKASTDSTLLDEVPIESKEGLVNRLSMFHNVKVKFNSHPDKGKISTSDITNTNDVDITKGVEVYAEDRLLFRLDKKESENSYLIKYKPVLGLSYKYMPTIRKIILAGKNLISDLTLLAERESIQEFSKIDFIGSVDASVDLFKYSALNIPGSMYLKGRAEKNGYISNYQKVIEYDTAVKDNISNGSVIPLSHPLISTDFILGTILEAELSERGYSIPLYKRNSKENITIAVEVPFKRIYSEGRYYYLIDKQKKDGFNVSKISVRPSEPKFVINRAEKKLKDNTPTLEIELSGVAMVREIRHFLKDDVKDDATILTSENTIECSDCRKAFVIKNETNVPTWDIEETVMRNGVRYKPLVSTQYKWHEQGSENNRIKFDKEPVDLNNLTDNLVIHTFYTPNLEYTDLVDNKEITVTKRFIENDGTSKEEVSQVQVNPYESFTAEESVTKDDVAYKLDRAESENTVIQHTHSNTKDTVALVYRRVNKVKVYDFKDSKEKRGEDIEVLAGKEIKITPDNDSTWTWEEAKETLSISTENGLPEEIVFYYTKDENITPKISLRKDDDPEFNEIITLEEQKYGTKLSYEFKEIPFYNKPPTVEGIRVTNDTPIIFTYTRKKHTVNIKDIVVDQSTNNREETNREALTVSEGVQYNIKASTENPNWEVVGVDSINKMFTGNETVTFNYVIDINPRTKNEDGAVKFRVRTYKKLSDKAEKELAKVEYITQGTEHKIEVPKVEGYETKDKDRTEVIDSSIDVTFMFDKKPKQNPPSYYPYYDYSPIIIQDTRTEKKENKKTDVTETKKNEVTHKQPTGIYRPDKVQLEKEEKDISDKLLSLVNEPLYETMSGALEIIEVMKYRLKNKPETQGLEFEVILIDSEDGSELGRKKVNVRDERDLHNIYNPGDTYEIVRTETDKEYTTLKYLIKSIDETDESDNVKQHKPETRVKAKQVSKVDSKTKKGLKLISKVEANIKNYFKSGAKKGAVVRLKLRIVEPNGKTTTKDLKFYSKSNYKLPIKRNIPIKEIKLDKKNVIVTVIYAPKNKPTKLRKSETTKKTEVRSRYKKNKRKTVKKSNKSGVDMFIDSLGL